MGSRSNWKLISNLMGVTKGFDKILDETTNIMVKETAGRDIDPRAKINEVKSVSPSGSVPLDNVTHFGDNRHVSNFFWWRANNAGSVK